MSSPKRRTGTLASHLAGDPSLSALLSKAERLASLQEVLSARLPAEAARACRVANIRGDTVVVHAANNAVAARCRLSVARLADGFRDRYPDVKQVKIEIQTQPAATGGGGHRHRIVIPPPAAPLEQLARDLPDSPLRNAVLSLATKSR
jgi:hypothetical protein